MKTKTYRAAILPEEAEPGDRVELDDLAIQRYVNRIANEAIAKLRRPQVYVGSTHVRRYTVRAHTRDGYWRSLPPPRRKK